MSIQEKIVGLCHGNPGAIQAMCEAMKYAQSIHADGAGFLEELERQDIRGSHIYICFSDLCKKDIQKFYNGILDKSLRPKLEDTIDYKWDMQTKKGCADPKFT